MQKPRGPDKRKNLGMQKPRGPDNNQQNEENSGYAKTQAPWQSLLYSKVPNPKFANLIYSKLGNPNPES